MDAAFLTWMLCLQSQQIRHLEAQFYTDSLTQVGNRAAFDRALSQIWTQQQTAGADFALLYLDGNNVKAVNDTYGHAAGDRVIVAIAESIRDQGQAFRLGGDEFALLITDTVSEAVLRRQCQRIQHRIWQAGRALQTELPIQSMLQGGRQLPILSAAIGWALASQVESTADLKMKADAAMYVNKWRSKRLGRYLDSARRDLGLCDGSAQTSYSRTSPAQVRCDADEALATAPDDISPESTSASASMWALR